MANPAQDSEPPRSVANVVPTDMANAGQTRILVDAIKESVAELKSEVTKIRDHRVTDLLLQLGALAAGFIVLSGMMIAAYFKIEGRLHEFGTVSTRVETKLDDLMQRIPPVPTPVPKK